MKRQYPQEIDAAERERQAHIPNETLIRDIQDTNEEIRCIRAVQGAEEIIAREHLGADERRMADFKAGARPAQAAERQELVRFLRLLLADRGYDLNLLDKPLGAK